MALLAFGLLARAEALPQQPEALTAPSPLATPARAVISFRAEPGSVCRIYPSIPGSKVPARPITAFADATGTARFYVTTKAPVERRELSATAVCLAPSGRKVEVPLRITAGSFLTPDSLGLRFPRPPRVIAASSSIGVLSSERLDVTKASDERLRELGYPNRPDPRRFSQAYKLWLYLVTTPGAYIPAQPVRMLDKRHGPAHAPVMLNPSEAPRLRAPNSSGAIDVASLIWSGYAVTSEQALPFTQVYGVWNVPTVTGTASLDYTASSEWVGIDGFGTPDVIQDGTEQDATLFLNWWFESYYAWYEYFPDTERAISGLEVQPGDQISAIAWTDQAADGTPEGSYVIINNSTGQGTFESETEPAGAGYPSATTVEWIMERPSYQTAPGTYTPYPLADYDAAQMTSAFYWQLVWPQGVGDSDFQDAPAGAIGNNFYRILMFLSDAYPAIPNGDTIQFLWYYSN